MKKPKMKSRKSYPPEFKAQAIELAKELGSKEAAEKLGIASSQTLAAWVRYDRKMKNDAEFRSLQELKEENKKLKKALEKERKVIAILKDAAAFFCQENVK